MDAEGHFREDLPACRYGCKQDATSLLQEWVRDIGTKAGLDASNTRLSSGSIGVPESRLEVQFNLLMMGSRNSQLCSSVVSQ